MDLDLFFFNVIIFDANNLINYAQMFYKSRDN
jgi:hypothetical protein